MKSKFIAVVSVVIVTAATLVAADAFGGGLERSTVEQKLHSDFRTAQRIHLTSLKENYWGLYRNFAVSFRAKFADGTYQMNCNVVDRDPSDLQLQSCSAINAEGKSVDVAKLYVPDTRLPASQQ